MDKQPPDAELYLAVRQRFAMEVRRAEREVKDAEAKLRHAKTRLEAADEMLREVHGAGVDFNLALQATDHGPYSKIPLRTSILLIVQANGAAGISVREMQRLLTEGGYPRVTSNFRTVVLVTCYRLEKEGLLESFREDGTKRFRITAMGRETTSLQQKEDNQKGRGV